MATLKRENYDTVGAYVNALANQQVKTSPLDDALKKHYNSDYISIYDDVNPQGFFRFNEPQRQAIYDALTPAMKGLADEGVPNTEEKYNQAAVMISEVFGMDLEDAQRNAPFIYSQLSERDMNKHGWGSQFGRQIANAFYGDMNGHAMTMYVLTGNKYWKEKADKMYEKQLKTRNWQDYGAIGNLALDQAQGLYSWGSFLIPSLLTAGVGGAVGLSSGVMKGLSVGLEVVQSGSSQMGANAYLMTKMTDDKGNPLLDVENMNGGEKAVYLGGALLMGGIEVGLMEGLVKVPGKLRQQISRDYASQVVEKSVQQALKQYTTKGFKGWAIGSVKDIAGEGVEEFLQQIVGNAFENIEAMVQNQRGANFQGYDAKHLTEGVWDAFKGGVSGSLLVGVLGSAYTNVWNDKNSKIAQRQVNSYQNVAENGSIIDTSVMVNKEKFTNEEIVENIERHKDTSGKVNIPTVNVEANGVATFKPATREDALNLASIQALNNASEITLVKVNYETTPSFNLSSIENKVAFASAIGGEVARDNTSTIVFNTEADLEKGLARLTSNYNVKEEFIAISGDGTTIHLENTNGDTVELTLVSNEDGSIETVDKNDILSDKQSAKEKLTSEEKKLTEDEKKALDNYVEKTTSTETETQETSTEATTPSENTLNAINNDTTTKAEATNNTATKTETTTNTTTNTAENTGKEKKPKAKKEFTQKQKNAITRAIAIVYKRLQKYFPNLKINDVLDAIEFVFDDNVNQSKIDIIEQGEGKLKKGVIHINENTTPKALIHEIGHFFRYNATSEDLKGYGEAYGINGADTKEWNRQVSAELKKKRGIANTDYTYDELFANDFVRYVENGTLPSKHLEGVFSTMKAMLVNIVDNFKGRLNAKTYETLRELTKGETTQKRNSVYKAELDIKRADTVLKNEKLTAEDRAKWEKYKAEKERLRNGLQERIDNIEQEISGKTTLYFTEEENNLDNKQKEDLNNGYERTDEFGRIQEESKRLLKELEHSTRTYRNLDEGLRGRYTGYIQDQLRAIKRGTSDVNEFNLTNTKGISFTLYGGVPPVLFHDAFETIKPYVVQNELVDLHDNYNNARCYLSNDGLQGFAIEEDGNLVSVFNADTNKRGYLSAIKNFVKEQGATHLDCYGYLAEKYNKYFGFKTASLMDYNMSYDHHNIAENYNSPQIAFMVNSSEDVETKHFDKDSYQEAKDYQMSFVNKNNTTTTLNYTEEQANDVIDNLTDDEATNLVNNAKAKGYAIPLRLAERVGDIDTLNKYADLDNLKLLDGVDYIAQAREYIENLDINANEETLESNLDEVLNKAKEQFVRDNTTEDTSNETKDVIGFAFEIGTIERSKDKDNSFLLQHASTKEQIVDTVDTILKRKRRSANGRTIIEVRPSGAYMLDEELKNITKNSSARDIKKAQTWVCKISCSRNFLLNRFVRE